MPPFGTLINPDYEASGGAFTPPDLALCSSWFTASLGVTKDMSDVVTSLADQSGAGLVPTFDLLGANPGPTWTASGIAGRPDLLWTGGLSTILGFNDPSVNLAGGSGVTLFAIVQTMNTAAGRMFGMQYNAFHYLLQINASGGLGDGIASYFTEDFTEARSDAPINDGVPHVIIATWSAADNLGRIYIDGTTPAIITAASSTPPTPGSGDVNAAGGGSDGTNNYQAYTGNMSEFGSYARALSDGGGADLVSLYNYLASHA